ncbi:MAG: hypothetical protein ACI8PW_001932 [Methylophilaceae bacterium]|jgi:hypothetical protein
MQNQPLSSNDQSKILIFSLLLAPTVVFGVGVIPALFIGFGIFMLRKHEDFSHIETAVRNAKGYFGLLSVGLILAGIIMSITDTRDWYLFIIFSSIPFAYLILLKALFFKPLKSHSEWVEKNGIFSSKPKLLNTQNNTSNIDIVKGDKLKQYSVADELMKWVKLKEDGHISEAEFNEARDTLLKR